MKKKQKPKKENGERWLLTYSDLITLLMIFFILLYTMSNVDKEKYSQLSETLSDSMGEGASLFSGATGVNPGDGSNTPVDLGGSGSQNSGNSQTPTTVPEATGKPGIDTLSGSLTTKQDMENLQEYVNQALDELNMDVSTETSVVERGLAITFRNDVFFDSGQDTLKEEMKIGLTQLAKLLNRVDNQIIIEGHTDNIPLSTKNKFTSNWQLSAARAANVAEYLVEEEAVDGNRISAVGYGEFHPITSNDTAEGRSKNRRVDVIILYDSSKQ